MEKLTPPELLRIVRTLIGPVNPVGESHTDAERKENLRALLELIDSLMCEAWRVHFHNKDRQEFSMRECSNITKEWFNETVNNYDEYLIEDYNETSPRARLKVGDAINIAFTATQYVTLKVGGRYSNTASIGPTGTLSGDIKGKVAKIENEQIVELTIDNADDFNVAFSPILKDLGG